MTATLTPETRIGRLTERLRELRDERVQAQREVAPTGTGDDADRATNVDAHIRLAMIEQHIDDIEFQLMTATEQTATVPGVVSVGATFTVDLGDGPEHALLGSRDQTDDDLLVITPGSPLGQALLGTGPGTTVTYRPRPRTELGATVISVD